MLVYRQCSSDPRLRRPPGFTLIELLTVVSIIALLIGILMPSLSNARNSAKKVKTRGTLSAIEKGLEMFHGDFNEYPDSRLRQDRIAQLPKPGGGTLDSQVPLSGAHWLARALVGPDSQGVDVGKHALGDWSQGQLLYKDFLPDDGTGTPGIYSQRKPVYLEGKVYAPDNDARFNTATGASSDFVWTGRPAVYDTFDGPILYYRANPKAMSSPPTQRIAWNTGVYRQEDNFLITGSAENSGSAYSKQLGWDFANTGLHHGIGDLINASNSFEDPPDDVTWKGRTFKNYFHNHAAHEIGGGTDNAIRPVNPDRFVLISAGVDGLYGTDDDVTNFE